METMTPVSVIRLMPESKDQVELFIQGATEQILNGQVDPLEAAIYLKTMEDVLKGIRDNKEIKEMIRFEVIERGGEVNLGNAKIKNVDRSNWDYSKDTHWKDLVNQIELLNEHRKNREKMLQILEKEVADPDSGEIVFPAKKTTIQYPRVTLK